MSQISEGLVNRAYQYHSSCFEEWQEGHPVDSWLDDEGTLCIRYESGKYWHYKQSGNEFTWW